MPNLAPIDTRHVLSDIGAISDYDLLYAAKRIKAMSRKERRRVIAEIKKRRLEIPE